MTEETTIESDVWADIMPNSDGAWGSCADGLRERDRSETGGQSRFGHEELVCECAIVETLM